MNKIFHVVCEGQTDFEIIKEVLKQVGSNNGEKYSANVLFPPIKKNIGGWSTLRNWCKERASELTGNTQRAKQAALLLGAKPAQNANKAGADKIAAALALKKYELDNHKSILIIHLDTDIADDLVIDANLPHVQFPLSVADRIAICDKALDNWLGGHVVKKNLSMFYCLTSLAMENWVLTLHAVADISKASKACLPDEHDAIQYPDKRLVSLGYSKESDGSLRKKASVYKNYGRRIAQNLFTCRSRSNILDKFCITATNA